MGNLYALAQQLQQQADTWRVRGLSNCLNYGDNWGYHVSYRGVEVHLPSTPDLQVEATLKTKAATVR